MSANDGLLWYGPAMLAMERSRSLVGVVNTFFRYRIIILPLRNDSKRIWVGGGGRSDIGARE